MPSNILTATVRVLTPGVKPAFDSVAKSAQDAATNIKSVGVASVPASNGLKVATTSAAGLFRGLGSIARIIPGIGMVGLASLLIGSVINGFRKSAEEAKKLDEALKKLAGQVAKDAVELTALVGIVQNVNAKNSDRERALRAINEQYGIEPEQHRVNDDFFDLIQQTIL